MKPLKYPDSHTTSVYIYLFDLQAKRNHPRTEPENNSPPFRRLGSSTFVGKEIHYLAANPLAGQQCG